MGLYSDGLIIGRIFASEIWGPYSGEGLFFLGGGELIIRIFVTGILSLEKSLPRGSMDIFWNYTFGYHGGCSEGG